MTQSEVDQGDSAEGESERTGDRALSWWHGGTEMPTLGEV